MYDLFNDTVSRSDYVATNDRIISKQWTEKYTEGNVGGLILDAIRNLPGES
jgi:hypothetical protein